MMKLRAVMAVLTLIASIPMRAEAQEWPNRPVRFIVPFPAGGSTDVGARLVGEYLSRSLHQQIVVENKSGANGNIGIETAAKSPADGYTVLVVTDAVSSNPHVYKMNVDPLKGLTPVIQLSRQPMVLAAHPSLGVASLAELIALARQQPGRPEGDDAVADLGADRAAAAGDVLDHDLLTERLAHVLPENAREHVGRPARGERHHHGDRTGGVGLLRLRARADTHQHRSRKCGMSVTPHESFSSRWD